MNQRIRSCTKSTNLDTVNCDAYRTRLQPRDKQTGTPHARKPSVGKKSRPVSQPINPRKELTTSSASVETVVHSSRPRGTSRSDSKSRQPWSTLLSSSKSVDSVSTFDSCDPLRTVHFLARELGSKLQSSAHNDPQVLDLILNMQHALSRVPHEVTSVCDLPSNGTCDVNGYHREIPVKLLPEKPPNVERGIQTNPSPMHLFDKQLEASTAKLQVNCEQLERAYLNLKNEKDEVEHLLRIESEKSARLQEQNGALRAENLRLTQQRDELASKLKCLKYQGNPSNDLKASLEQLQGQKAQLDTENIALRHRLAKSDIEKEKFVTLLSMRDRQINEILSEIDSLQTVVGDQLCELQKVATAASPASSVTTVLSEA